MIRVTVSENSMGDVILTPVNKRIRKRAEKHMLEMNGNADSTVLLREGIEFLDLTARQRRDMCGGYDITINMDPWKFGMMLGYDAQYII